MDNRQLRVGPRQLTVGQAAHVIAQRLECDRKRAENLVREWWKIGSLPVRDVGGNPVASFEGRKLCFRSSRVVWGEVVYRYADSDYVSRFSDSRDDGGECYETEKGITAYIIEDDIDIALGCSSTVDKGNLQHSHTVPAEARVRKFFEELVAEFSGAKIARAVEIKALARERFGVGRNGVDRAWDTAGVPDSWRQRGRIDPAARERFLKMFPRH